MRRIRLLVCLAVVLSAAPGSAGAACAGPEEPPLSVDVPTLSLTLQADRSSYRPGNRALVLARVRSAAGTKVGGADITVELTRKGTPFRKLYGRTTDTGDARLAVRLPATTSSRGTVDAFGTARLTAVPSYDCRAALVYQYGEKRTPGLLTIR